MYMITKFHLFEQSNFRSVVNIDKINSMDLFNRINQEFQDDAKLTKGVNKTKEKEIIINITYNDTYKHPIKDRIQNRIELLSISDFNKLLEEGLFEFINKNGEEYLSNNINISKFAIYFNEYRFSAVFTIQNISSRLYQGKYITFYKIYINTILNSNNINDVKKIQNIDILL
jgi:hypothetical protein